MTITRLRPALALVAAFLATVGTASAQGAVQGLTVVTSPAVVVAAGTQARGTVQCPGRKVPLGGGAFIGGSDLTVGIASSFPSARSWVVDVGNPSAAAASFQIRVLCARAPKQYSLSVGLFTPLAP